jgi:membrane-associated protein
MIEFIQTLLHIDATLLNWMHEWGPHLYWILFLIVFAETGLVITPFLPGDSLLFAVGALAANPDFLKLEIIAPALVLAATMGDSLNYFIGRKLGRGLFEKGILFLKKDYLENTEKFYAEKGIWAISLSRFFPIIRTFSPFFAGMSLIPYRKFLLLSFLGSLAWVGIFSMAGYFFGQVEIVQKNFTALVMGIIFVSMVPIILNVVKSRVVKSSRG